MSTPHWIQCHDSIDIPAIPELCQFATRDQHVILQFPLNTTENIEKSRIIQQLTSHLPAYYRVFDSGGNHETTWITVKRVLEPETILGHAKSFVDAIERFLALADELLARLAQKHRIPIEEFEYARSSGQLPGTSGTIDDQWQYYFHGLGCRFQHTITKQIVDITLRRPKNRYARLDPYFLAEYLYSTPEEHELATLLQEQFHDTVRVLEVLSERGYVPRGKE